MNPVLILTHNCLELTKRCIESIRAQDTSDVKIFVLDNGSTDGTIDWIYSQKDIYTFLRLENDGVSAGWNRLLGILFHCKPHGLHKAGWCAEHVLVVNNDTILAPWTYRKMLEYDAPFVTGVSYTDLDAVMSSENMGSGPTPGPDFSCFLIRRDCWENVGPFDENMVHYCSDVDYDIRARKAGIMLQNSHIKFYHERSSTIRLSPDCAAIHEQSAKDHEAFRAKYGVLPGQPGYERIWQVNELAK